MFFLSLCECRSFSFIKTSQALTSGNRPVTEYICIIYSLGYLLDKKDLCQSNRLGIHQRCKYEEVDDGNLIPNRLQSFNQFGIHDIHWTVYSSTHSVAS